MDQLVTIFSNIDDTEAAICSALGVNFCLAQISEKEVKLLINSNIIDLMKSPDPHATDSIFVMGDTPETSFMDLDFKDHNAGNVDIDGREITFKLMNILWINGFPNGAELLLSEKEKGK